MILKEYVNPKDRTVRAEVVEGVDHRYGVRYYANGDLIKQEFYPVTKSLDDVQKEASEWVDRFQFLV